MLRDGVVEPSIIDTVRLSLGVNQHYWLMEYVIQKDTELVQDFLIRKFQHKPFQITVIRCSYHFTVTCNLKKAVSSGTFRMYRYKLSRTVKSQLLSIDQSWKSVGFGKKQNKDEGLNGLCWFMNL